MCSIHFVFLTLRLFGVNQRVLLLPVGLFIFTKARVILLVGLHSKRVNIPVKFLVSTYILEIRREDSMGCSVIRILISLSFSENTTDTEIKAPHTLPNSKYSLSFTTTLTEDCREGCSVTSGSHTLLKTKEDPVDESNSRAFEHTF